MLATKTRLNARKSRYQLNFPIAVTLHERPSGPPKHRRQCPTTSCEQKVSDEQRKSEKTKGKRQNSNSQLPTAGRPSSTQVLLWSGASNGTMGEDMHSRLHASQQT